jgi:hypothetical protein
VGSTLLRSLSLARSFSRAADLRFLYRLAGISIIQLFVLVNARPFSRNNNATSSHRQAAAQALAAERGGPRRRRCYGAEAWRTAYTCRLSYYGDGSETSSLLLRALATRAPAAVVADGELTTRCRLSHAARVGSANRVRVLVHAGSHLCGDACVRACAV